ncbi:hypothetical protein P7K49_011759 [Saguinus oedipus]|uniref:Uncharacterized protein n=1 Tax=Saguinus oedipus TaxID=9490 RepID=A0ABQ9VV48_SAGOE|nr:hypothetical protein P7K49_011759 [Saguinus oedipus]
MGTGSLSGERDPGLWREGPQGAAGRAGGREPRRGGPLPAAVSTPAQSAARSGNRRRSAQPSPGRSRAQCEPREGRGERGRVGASPPGRATRPRPGSGARQAETERASAPGPRLRDRHREEGGRQGISAQRRDARGESGRRRTLGAQSGGGWRTRTLKNRALGLDPGGERGGEEEAEETGARRTREKDAGEAPKTFVPGVAEPSFSFAWHGGTAGPGAVRGRGSLGCRGPQLLLLVAAGAEGGEQGRDRGLGLGSTRAKGSEKGVRRRKGAVRLPSLVARFPQVCWAPAAHLPPRPDPFPRHESRFFPCSSAPSLPQPSALPSATWENRSAFQGSGLLQMLARARVPGFQSAKGRVGREGAGRAWSGAGPWLRTSGLCRSLGASPRIPDGRRGGEAQSLPFPA